MMTIHFHADLRPVVKERVGMLHWIADPACSGFIIAYELGANHVLISNCDVIFPLLPLYYLEETNNPNETLTSVPSSPGSIQ